MVAEPVSEHCRELEIIDIVKELDLNRLTPLEALQKLFDIQGRLLDIDDPQLTAQEQEREEE